MMIHIVSLLVLSFATSSLSANYLIGAGIYDITGPAAEVNMMGYAMLDQITNGLHLRLFSRAFVIADASNRTRFAFVSIDACMGSQSIKLEVLKKLQSIYGTLYTAENVAISGTHTHSGPGGYLQYLLFDITSVGFVRESLDVIVDGIVMSIQMAHDQLQPGDIFFNNGTLLEANINRSPSAYQYNTDKDHYEYNVDKQFVLLKLVSKSGKGIGMINWFAVHGTSMNNTNGLISGDNKGYAEFLMEQYMNGNGSIPGQGPFVAAFAQSNLGDVSPNTRGAFCADTGLPCDYNHSTCNGKNELCRGIGPGKDMFQSTEIIGRKQFEKALELYNSAMIPVVGPVDFRQAYVDMTKYTFELDNTVVHTCPPAMGYAFAAGTTDGPGAFNFIQNETHSNPLWNAVRDLIKAPSPEQVKCHYPKPILLDTGEMHEPYDWQAPIVDTQLLRIGQFVIAPVPGEFT
jgi:neutral ceramidase